METTESPAFECRFCRKVFASKSTYGRHLDLKRADALHPAPEVDAIRGAVVRRGENRQLDETRLAQLKKGRQRASRAYNAKEDVRERNKQRRKQRDTRISASVRANEWFLTKLSGGEIGGCKTFTQMVAVHLPPTEWPEEGVPGETQLQKLLATQLGENPDQVFAAWNKWKSADGDKLAIWQQDSRNAAIGALKGTSVFELVNCRQVVEAKRREVYDQLSQPDLFDMIVTDSEMGATG